MYDHGSKMSVYVKLLLLLQLALSSHRLPAHANPVDSAILNFKGDIGKLNREEIDDMNLKVLDIPAGREGYSSREFLHRDEDQVAAASTTTRNANSSSDNNLDSLKYEVEMLEPLKVERGHDDDDDAAEELEERFRGGAALQVNTDTFAAENIEVGKPTAAAADQENVAVLMATPENRLTLTIILVAVAVFSIGLYAILVIWRSHLERRYGMRQLLVTISDDDYFADAAVRTVHA